MKAGRHTKLGPPLTTCLRKPSPPSFPQVQMVSDLIAPLLVCVVLGCALSLVVAASLTRPGGKFTLSGVASRLVLAAGPIYLVVSDAADQGAGPMAAAAAGLLLGLYCLRGWWAPDRLSIRYSAGSAFHTALNILRVARPGSAISAAASLRHRMLSVVDADRRLEEHRAGADRRLERPARERSFARAA